MPEARMIESDLACCIPARVQDHPLVIDKTRGESDIRSNSVLTFELVGASATEGCGASPALGQWGQLLQSNLLLMSALLRPRVEKYALPVSLSESFWLLILCTNPKPAPALQCSVCMCACNQGRRLKTSCGGCMERTMVLHPRDIPAFTSMS